jgi:hypothetical protein
MGSFVCRGKKINIEYQIPIGEICKEPRDRQDKDEMKKKKGQGEANTQSPLVGRITIYLQPYHQKRYRGKNQKKRKGTKGNEDGEREDGKQ